MSYIYAYDEEGNIITGGINEQIVNERLIEKTKQILKTSNVKIDKVDSKNAIEIVIATADKVEETDPVFISKA